MSPPDRHRNRWLAVHLVLLAVAAGVLAWANRGQWFFGDEWEFLVNRGFAGARWSLWAPHNEHWSTVPILVYTFLRNVVGLGSYWPFISVLIATHLALTHLLWRAMLRSGTLPAVATTAAAVFSLLGSGAENLLWAFQIGFVGSLAFGWAAALVAATPAKRPGPRDLWAALLLVFALMCSGIGVPMVVVAAVAVWGTSRAVWRPLVVGGLPTTVFLVWYVTVGRAPARADIEGRGTGQVLSLLLGSTADTAERAFGTPRPIAVALLVLLAAWSAWVAVGVVRGVDASREWSLALGGVAGVVAFGLMIAAGRSLLGLPRYVYIAVAMMLPLVAVALTRLSRRRWVQAVVIVAIAAVGVHNVVALRAAAAREASRESWTREVIEAAGVLATNGTSLLGRLPEPVYDPDVTVMALRTLVERSGLPAVTTDRGDLGARLFLQVVDLPPGGAPASVPAVVADIEGLAEMDARPGCLAPDGGEATGEVSFETDGRIRSVWLLGEGARYDIVLGEGDSASPARYVGVPQGEVTELSWNLPLGAPDLVVRPKSATSLVCLTAP